MSKSAFYYNNPDAPKPNQPIGIGVVGLIVHRDSLLLERRTDSDRWAIIGGAIESEESLLQALKREVLEETGLIVASAELFGTFSDPSRIIAFADGKVKRIITIAYRAEVEPFSELICSEESVELRFFDREQLQQIEIAETHIPIIRAYLENRAGAALE